MDEAVIPGLPSDICFQILLRLPRKKIYELRSVSKLWREILTSNSFFSARKIHDLAEPWLYTAISDWKGVNSWFAFDPSYRQWHVLPPIPDAEHRHVLTLQMSVLDNKLLVSGIVEKEHSTAGARGAFSYDPVLNEWSRAAPSLIGRWFCLSGVVGGHVYVAGGLGTTNNLALVQTVEKYSPETDSWHLVDTGAPMDLMTLPGYQVTLKDTFYAKNIGWGSKFAVAFNPITQTMTDVSPNMVQGWNGPTATMGGRIYSVDFCNNHRLKVWSSESDSWHPVADVVMFAGSQKAWAVQLSSYGGTLCMLLPDLTLITADVGSALKDDDSPDWSTLEVKVEVIPCSVRKGDQVGDSSVYTASTLGCKALYV